VVWVIVAILVIAVAVLAFLVFRRRRSERLHQRFGPEYDRVVDERGDRGEAEAELQQRAKRRSSFEVRPLSDQARDAYAQRWEIAQRHFVDQPAAAISEADELVMEVMAERGYPVENDFEQRAADVSVDHPEVVEHYRAAHATSQGATRGDASTEDLRQAMVHFRALFAELLDSGQRETSHVGRT